MNNGSEALVMPAYDLKVLCIEAGITPADVGMGNNALSLRELLDGKGCRGGVATKTSWMSKIRSWRGSGSHGATHSNTSSVVLNECTAMLPVQRHWLPSQAYSLGWVGTAMRYALPLLKSIRAANSRD